MFFAEQFLLFVGVLMTTGLFIKWRRKRDISSYRYPPSLPCLPLVGSLPFIRNLNDISVFFMKKADELGPIFTFRVGNSLVLTLNSKEAIEKSIVKNPSIFSDRPKFVHDSLVNPENKGVSFKIKATDWRKSQQISLTVLKELGFGVKSIMEMRISNEIEAITEFAKDKNGEAFDPSIMCCLATSNIMMNMLFGRRCDYDLGLSDVTIQAHRYVSNLSNIYDIVPIVKYFPPYRQKINTMVEASKELFKINELEIARSLQNTGESCFVQSYVQKTGPGYDRAELNYLLRDLFVAGTDTSSITTLWCFVALANNPDVQKRLHDEIDAVIAGDQLPTLQDEAKLPYVEATILEITRWRTLVPLAVPRATSRDCVVDGYFIPGGTRVMTNLYAIHNNATVWKDPDVFRPERFLDGENNVIGREDVMPFSIGRRSCLGETLARAEIFLIITSLVKRFLILPPEGQDKLNEDPRMPASVVSCPMPFKIRLIERK